MTLGMEEEQIETDWNRLRYGMYRINGMTNERGECPRFLSWMTTRIIALFI